MTTKSYSLILFTAFSLLCFKSGAQVLTPEDSLTNGLIRRTETTVLSGYGEARYSIDTKRKSAEANLRRVVLFVGHKFSKNISFFSELEVENALVTGGGADESTNGKGSISMEQAFLKFNLNPATYIVAGLILPRIGIINENHLPTTFNGVDRPYLEEQIIPSTWREVGVAIYGQATGIRGLNYSVALTNGLNSSNFSSAEGIGGGRQLGQAAKGLNLGLNASLLYYLGDFRMQVSGYMGGSTAEEKRVADSLQLNSGPFGNPVTLGEANISYSRNGIAIKTIGTFVHVQNASDINRAYANNSPETMYGAYGELGYDLFYHKQNSDRALIVFGRYEYINMNAKIPANGISNEANRKNYIVAGLTYKPIRGISIKGDYTRLITGEFNQALIVTPFPRQVFYYKNNGFVNLGVAYSF